MSKYGNFDWNKTLFVEWIYSFFLFVCFFFFLFSFADWIGVKHLLRDITLWTNWVECNGNGFNSFQWHVSKIKYLIWVECITYAKATWARVLRHAKISPILANALLDGFDQMYGSLKPIPRVPQTHCLILLYSVSPIFERKMTSLEGGGARVIDKFNEENFNLWKSTCIED